MSYNYYQTPVTYIIFITPFYIVLFLSAKFLCVIVINNLFNSTENTYYKKLAHLILLLSEYQCNLNKTTLTCNLTKLLAFITKKKKKKHLQLQKAFYSTQWPL